MNKHKAFVIGIAGGSASGKSTFSQALENTLQGVKTHVIHMDSYFKPEQQRPRACGPVSPIEYLDDNHPLTIDLPKLAVDLAKAATCGKHDIVIVEGLLTLWDKAVYDQLNLRIFVDCKPDERIVRRLRRNMEWGLAFDEISSVYLDLVRYRHDEFVEPSKWRADFMMNGSNFSATALEMIAEYVKIKTAD